MNKEVRGDRDRSVFLFELEQLHSDPQTAERSHHLFRV